MPHTPPAPVSATPETPLLDHVIVMLDGDAYRDILASGALREELGRVKVKEAVSSYAGTYTSCIVAGHNTAVQLFDAALPSFPGLTSGLVFTFQTPGVIAEVRRRLEAVAATPVDYELVRRAKPGQPKEEAPPAYHMVEPDFGEESPFLVTLDESFAEYYDAIGAPVGPNGELYRSAYFDAAMGAPPSPGHRFKDIVEVAVRLRGERVQQVAATMTALDWSAEEEDGETVLRGPGAALRLVPDEEALEGVLWLRLSLTEPGEGVHRFGETSALSYEADGTALWSFTPPVPSARDEAAVAAASHD
ncbi:MAG TPA: hypothetical protein VHG91_16180 [Longimicrobium sp.]|nr:hypothetical protein [Longimicrobium sp.]